MFQRPRMLFSIITSIGVKAVHDSTPRLPAMSRTQTELIKPAVFACVQFRRSDHVQNIERGTAQLS